MKKYLCVFILFIVMIACCGPHRPINVSEDSHYPLDSCLSLKEQKNILPQIGCNFGVVLKGPDNYIHSCYKKENLLYVLYYHKVGKTCIRYDAACIKVTLNEMQEVIESKRVFYYSEYGSIDAAKLGFDHLVKEGFIPDSLFHSPYSLNRAFGC